MAAESRVVVTSAGGGRGSIDTSSWPLDGSKPDVLVQFDDGRHLLVPLAALSRLENGTYALNLDQAERRDRQAAGDEITGQPVVVPVMVEELDVQRRRVETGRVRIHKTVHEHEELVDEPLFQEEVVIERVPINRVVEEAIPIRYEGDTMIVSLLEEVPVIEKRLVLKEELRITKRRVAASRPLHVLLRSEEATVEHLDINDKNPPSQ
jgi:uncharacterized protein (TIGR02271 family)